MPLQIGKTYKCKDGFHEVEVLVRVPLDKPILIGKTVGARIITDDKPGKPLMLWYDEDGHYDVSDQLFDIDPEQH